MKAKCNSITLLHYFFFFFFLSVFFLERVHTCEEFGKVEGRGEGEEEKESQADSTPSVEPKCVF